MPEEYQELIMVNHPQRSPFKSGYNKRWLCEETMNVFVNLDQDRRQEHAYFGAHLMSLVSEDYDKVMQDGSGSTYLEH